MIIVMLFPSFVYADWQYTKWGMSVDAVVKASNGIAKPDLKSQANSTGFATSLLVAPYKAGRFEFTAHFLFDKQTQGLSRVDLKLKKPSECSSVWRELGDKYGEPKIEKEVSRIMEGATWWDEKANNGITIIQIGNNDCTIWYWQLTGPINKGL
jgi:hypothetical protein